MHLRLIFTIIRALLGFLKTLYRLGRFGSEVPEPLVVLLHTGDHTSICICMPRTIVAAPRAGRYDIKHGELSCEFSLHSISLYLHITMLAIS